jgi:hypothetical protein
MSTVFIGHFQIDMHIINCQIYVGDIMETVGVMQKIFIINTVSIFRNISFIRNIISFYLKLYRFVSNHTKVVSEISSFETCVSIQKSDKDDDSYSRRAWRYQREVIRIRKSKKNRQRNVHKKKDKGINNDLQNITQKTKDRVTRTPLNIR